MKNQSLRYVHQLMETENKQLARLHQIVKESLEEAEVKGQGDLLFDAEGKLVSGPKKG